MMGTYTTSLAFSVVAVLLGGCSSAPEAGASSFALTSSLTCLTIKRGTNGTVADAYIKSNGPRKNFGAQPILRVSARDETLLSFDLSSIPTTAAIGSATLRLYANGANADGTTVVHRALVPWSEDSVTFTSFGQAFSSDVAGAFRVDTKTSLNSVDLTSLVASWVAGVQPNYGVVLRPEADHLRKSRGNEDEDNDPSIFVSSDATNVSKRPGLDVCYTTADHCSPNPCIHGGTCVNGPSDFTCQCPPGFAGSICEINIDECDASPCLNGGVCTEGAGSYTCACPAGFEGARCETNIDECSPNPCQNGGVCADGIASHTCTCAAGYDGPECSHLIDNCASYPCHNGGTCENMPGGYSCRCAPGFVGVTCDTNIDDCVGNGCQNGATCVDGTNTYSCACAPDWGGSRCETNLNTCSLAPCLNGGTCVNGSGSYTCMCLPGYFGQQCEMHENVPSCAPEAAAIQVFGPTMIGCAGSVTAAVAATLCAPSCHLCSAQEWTSNSNPVPPAHDYWTATALGYSMSSGCAAIPLSSSPPPNACPAGMGFGVCAPTQPDPEGNTCNVTGCGLVTSSPNQHFGGCIARAGALCCCP
jgi:hypothetical protein